jgi:Asp-tRNA(Asn)/Glu-tRNA(Gln) amidotransferase A subunit family amidase
MGYEYSASPEALELVAAPRAFSKIAARFADGTCCPSEELEIMLKRIELHEASVNAFASLVEAQARDAAAASDARWRQRKPLSAIDGIVMGIKDIIETVDMPTGQGSPLWAGSRTLRDAASVQALREAGAIILGKTTTTEFALTESFHRTRNPRDLQRTPGGSSSGSAAAVVAGFVHAALGTQVMGSTIRPASFCGCVGFKPTFGALNRSGSFDHLSQSCIGILANDLADVWHVANAIVSRVGGDPGFRGLEGPVAPPRSKGPRRLAVLRPTGGWDRSSIEARTAFEAALDQLAERGVELVGGSKDQDIARLETALGDANQRVTAILNWEMRWPLGGYIKRLPSAVSPAMCSRLDAGNSITLADYRLLLDWRARLRSQYRIICTNFDATLSLSATGAAPLGFGSTGDPAMNVPASTLGVPSVSLPLLAEAGLPLGLQVIGAADQDYALLELCQWLVERLISPPVNNTNQPN